MSLSRQRLRQYAGSFKLFALDLTMANGKRFGDISIPEQVEWITAIEPALIALTKGNPAPLRKYMLEATKGFGKDLLLAVAVTWLVVFSPRTLLIQIAADDFDQAAEFIKSAKDILRNNTLLAPRYDIQIARAVNPETESAAEVLTRDKLGSHGARPDLLIINELSHCSVEEFAATLMDNATKMPNGVVILAGNSGFLDSWQWKWRELSRKSEDWHFFQYNRPAPWINKGDLEEAQLRNTRSRYRRLFHGEWASGLGDAIDMDDLAACCKHRGPMTEAEAGWSFLAGLDLGTKHDHSALVVVGVHTQSNRVRLANVLRWKPINGRIRLDHVRSAVIFAQRNYRLIKCFFDPDQAMLLAEDCSRYGVVMEEMRSTGRNLNIMATSILESFRGHIIEIYPNAAFIGDLQKLKIIEKAYGYKIEASSDLAGHADSAFALALCLPAAIELAAAGFAGPYEPPTATAHPRSEPQLGMQLASSGRGPLSQSIRLAGGRLSPRGEVWTPHPMPWNSH